MKVEITDVNNIRKEMKIFVPKEEVNTLTDEIFRDVSKGATVPGFRKGKAPRSVLRMYYADYIQSELSKKIVKDKFEEAVKEHELFVVSMPEIDNQNPKENEDFSFTAKFDVKPDIKPQVYSGLELKKPKIKVEDQNIQDVLERLQETYATVKDVEDTEYQVSKGDYVIVNLACDDHEKLNRDKITIEAGVRSAFPGLENEVIGLKAKDTKVVDITFPETHFMEEMRGKTASIRVEVQNIKTKELPEINDEFAQMVYKDVKNIDELKETIRDDLIKRLESDARNYMEKQLTQKLIEANPFDVPESMIRLQAVMMLQGISQRLSAQGIRMQDVYPDTESLREETMTSAENLVRNSMLVEAIARIKGIEVSDGDVEEEITSLSKKYGMTPDGVRKSFEERGGMEEVSFSILERKVFDDIIANSTVVEVENMEENKDDADPDSSGTDE
jgi:trigger factor